MSTMVYNVATCMRCGHPKAQCTCETVVQNIPPRRTQQMDKEDMLGAPPEINWTENSAFARKN